MLVFSINASASLLSIDFLRRGSLPGRRANIVPPKPEPVILPSKKDVKDKALESIVENRLKRFELEIGHLKSEIRELHIDIQYLQELIMKYITDHKNLLEKISLRDDF